MSNRKSPQNYAPTDKKDWQAWLRADKGEEAFRVTWMIRHHYAASLVNVASLFHNFRRVYCLEPEEAAKRLLDWLNTLAPPPK